MCMYLQFVYFEEREVPVIPVERSPASLSSSWDSCQGHLSSDHTFKLPSNVLVKKLVEKICQTEGKGCGGGGGRVVGQGGSVWLRGLSQVPLQKWEKETCTVWGPFIVTKPFKSFVFCENAGRTLGSTSQFYCSIFEPVMHKIVTKVWWMM